MAKGFIYVVRTVTRDYAQTKRCVPSPFGDRLYFGLCKRRMRPRMNEGDYIFGISPSRTRPRRIVFVTRIEMRMTYAQAYVRRRDLRGPIGPVHVRPIRGVGGFPNSSYQHIPGSIHPRDWTADLATRELDCFFECCKYDGWLGRWLGPDGPEIDDQILDFLKKCNVFGTGARALGPNGGTKKNPIAFGRLFTGLHVETPNPKFLLELCGARMNNDFSHTDRKVTKLRKRDRTTPHECAEKQPRSCR